MRLIQIPGLPFFQERHSDVCQVVSNLEPFSMSLYYGLGGGQAGVKAVALIVECDDVKIPLGIWRDPFHS